MGEILVGGYDSAWGAGNCGAIAYLNVSIDDRRAPRVRLSDAPRTVTWGQAADDLIARRPAVLAIDQPLVVANGTGCRPVERVLSQRLSKAHCGAYPSHQGHTCFAPGAPIWLFLERLRSNGFVHDPCGARVPDGAATLNGHRYFECYPHLAILGFTGRESILKYKVGHRNAGDWQQLLALVATRVSGFDQTKFTSHTKANEDILDAIVCALVAASWITAPESSCIVGSLSTGYMVTPISPYLQEALQGALVACENERPPELPLPETATVTPSHGGPSGFGGPAASTPTAATDTVEMLVNDTGNLWGRRNKWLTSYTGFAKLRVTLLDEDGTPEIVFVPFDGQGGPGVKIDRTDEESVSYWNTLAEGASNENVLPFKVTFRYES